MRDVLPVTTLITLVKKNTVTRVKILARTRGYDIKLRLLSRLLPSRGKDQSFLSFDASFLWRAKLSEGEIEKNVIDDL